jgi:Protein of unknown function (DUF2924)
MRASRTKSSGLAERAATTTSDTLLSLGAPLTAIADLDGLDLEGLRRQWRNHLGGVAPAHLPTWLLVKALGHRLQVATFGDLDKSVRRLIREENDVVGDRSAAPFDPRDPQTREGVGLKPGALLVREWQGKLERVMILEEGFAWNGRNFGSLSQIAKAITGTNWNGHRFFGLRQRHGTSANPTTGGRRRPLRSLEITRGGGFSRSWFDDVTKPSGTLVAALRQREVELS